MSETNQSNKGINHSKNFTHICKEAVKEPNKTYGLIKHGDTLVHVIWDDCKIIKPEVESD